LLRPSLPQCRHGGWLARLFVRLYALRRRHAESA
jgi:hypothetical protein